MTYYKQIPASDSITPVNWGEFEQQPIPFETGGNWSSLGSVTGKTLVSYWVLRTGQLVIVLYRLLTGYIIGV